MIRIKWIYDKPDIHDGVRILIERRWPRGMRRSSQHVDIWLKRIGPSEELHRWLLHNPGKWSEYEKRYTKEMKDSTPFRKLVDIAIHTDTVTLLFNKDDHEKNDAAVVWVALQKTLSERNPDAFE
jgi:Uncharacterized conserved protein